jgi:hypothetical protein
MVPIIERKHAMNDTNDDGGGPLLTSEDVREIKLEFAQVAALRYRDHIAETLQAAIQNRHIEAAVGIAVLMEVAAIIAGAGLGPDDGARFIELQAHVVAERMKQPRPNLN